SRGGRRWSARASHAPCPRPSRKDGSREPSRCGVDSTLPRAPSSSTRAGASSRASKRTAVASRARDPRPLRRAAGAATLWAGGADTRRRGPPGGCRPGREHPDGRAHARGAERHSDPGTRSHRAGYRSRTELLLARRAALRYPEARPGAVLSPPPPLPTGGARVLPVPRSGLRDRLPEQRLGAEPQPDLDPGDRLSRRTRSAGLPRPRPARAALTGSPHGIMLAAETLGEPPGPAAEKAGGDLPTPRT